MEQFIPVIRINESIFLEIFLSFRDHSIYCIIVSLRFTLSTHKSVIAIVNQGGLCNPGKYLITHIKIQVNRL